MAQVVTNENIGEFIANRRVAEFVPPATPAAASLANVPSKEDMSAATGVAGIDTATADVQARGPDGKFVPKTDAPAAAPATGAETDDADLPERVRRQIGKKHREKMEAEEFARERDADAAKEKARADALEKRLAALETKSGPTPAKSDGAPKPEDFKTVAEYADALTEFKLDQKLKARDEAEATKRAQADEQRAREALDQRIAATAREIPDYNEVVGAVDTIVPGHMAAYIAESELGPLMGYHLAKHPDELERLSKLSPIRAVAELGKLEAKLEKPPAAAKPATVVTPAVSRAPSPITPLEGGVATAGVAKDPATMNFQELRAHRQAERAAGKR